MAKKPKRTVEFEGRVYKVKSDKIEIPDLAAMGQFDALSWLCRHTYPRGYQKAAHPLTGMAGAITIGTR